MVLKHHLIPLCRCGRAFPRCSGKGESCPLDEVQGFKAANQVAPAPAALIQPKRTYVKPRKGPCIPPQYTRQRAASDHSRPSCNVPGVAWCRRCDRHGRTAVTATGIFLELKDQRLTASNDEVLRVTVKMVADWPLYDGGWDQWYLISLDETPDDKPYGLARRLPITTTQRAANAAPVIRTTRPRRGHGSKPLPGME